MQPFRTEAIDCPVETTAAGCTQPSTGRPVDTPTATSRPSVERPRCTPPARCGRRPCGPCASGSATPRPTPSSPGPWSCRPNDPTMLDMRNAIVQANLVVYAGSKTQPDLAHVRHPRHGLVRRHHRRRRRLPAGELQDRRRPRRPRARTITGKVTDGTTGDPIGGALVAITGHSSGFTGDYTAVDEPGRHLHASRTSTSARTRWSGSRLRATRSSPGRSRSCRAATRRTSHRAATGPRQSGGGVVTAFNGPDFSPQCGPIGSIDLSQGTGWGSTTGDDAGDPTDKMIPKYVDDQAAVDDRGHARSRSTRRTPVATRAAARPASTRSRRRPTAARGRRRSRARSTPPMRHLNQLDARQADQRRELRQVLDAVPAGPGLPAHLPATGNYGGCTFTDMTEIEVFGNS